MKCKLCGAEIPDDAVFCPVCGGNLQSRRCVNCGEVIDEDATFCPFCGAAQPHEHDEHAGADNQGYELLQDLGIVDGNAGGGSEPEADASSQNAPEPPAPQPESMTPEEKKRDNKVYWIAGVVGFLTLTVAILLIAFRAELGIDIFGGHDRGEIIDRHGYNSYEYSGDSYEETSAPPEEVSAASATTSDVEFYSSSDVTDYLMGKTFMCGDVPLRFASEGVYFKNQLITGPITVDDYSGSTATVESTFLHDGSTKVFRIDASNGSVTDPAGTVYFY